MPELVRVDAPSLASVEAFLTAAAGRPVRLGRVWLAPGRLGAAVAALARASAVTLGRVVCLERERGRQVLAAAPPDALATLGSLLVHECAHVWQYQRDGTIRFLIIYLFSYFKSIYRLRAVGLDARRRAYHDIPAEEEAFALELRWCQLPVPDPPARIVVDQEAEGRA